MITSLSSIPISLRQPAGKNKKKTGCEGPRDGGTARSAQAIDGALGHRALEVPRCFHHAGLSPTRVRSGALSGEQVGRPGRLMAHLAIEWPGRLPASPLPRVAQLRCEGPRDGGTANLALALEANLCSEKPPPAATPSAVKNNCHSCRFRRNSIHRFPVSATSERQSKRLHAC